MGRCGRGTGRGCRAGGWRVHGVAWVSHVVGGLENGPAAARGLRRVRKLRRVRASAGRRSPGKVAWRKMRRDGERGRRNGKGGRRRGGGRKGAGRPGGGPAAGLQLSVQIGRE